MTGDGPNFVSILDTQLIDRSDLLEAIGKLDRNEMAAVDSALGHVMGLSA